MSRKRKPIAGESPSLLVNELRRVYLEAGSPEILKLAELSGVDRNAISDRLTENTDARALVSIERIFAALGYIITVVKADNGVQKKRGALLDAHSKVDAPRAPKRRK